HQAGRTPTEKDGVEDTTWRFIRSTLQFSEICIAPCGLVYLTADVAIEVAIGALCLAKWPMDI
ncbi:hypothetical protein LCGC14_2031200, partial [marine sediment metagenome]